MVVIATGGIGTKATINDYPNISGIIAGTTKQEDRLSNLQPEQSKVTSEKSFGL